MLALRPRSDGPISTLSVSYMIWAQLTPATRYNALIYESSGASIRYQIRNGMSLTKRHLPTFLDMSYNISPAIDKACMLSQAPTCVKYWGGSSTLSGRVWAGTGPSQLTRDPQLHKLPQLGHVLAAHGFFFVEHLNAFYDTKMHEIGNYVLFWVQLLGDWACCSMIPRTKIPGEGSSPLGLTMYALSSLWTKGIHSHRFLVH